MPELRQLRAFVAVAEHLSFTRAAGHLHLTQQTVSKSIGDLERELGIELLERTTREVRLTDAGRALLEPTRETLRQLETALATARAVSEGRVGSVRVGHTPSISSVDINDVAQAIRSEAEGMTVTFREVAADELRRALTTREVDIALSRTVGADDPRIHRAELRPTPAAVFVSADHPLAAKGSAELGDFDGERLVTASPPGTPFTDLLVDRFAQGGATVEVVLAQVTGGSASLLTDLPHAGAIAVKPASTPDVPGVKRIDVDGLTIPLLLLWPAGLPSQTALWLRQALAPERAGHQAEDA